MRAHIARFSRLATRALGSRRERQDPDARRRVLLDQIAEYEAWWHAHQRLRTFGEPAYAAALGRFLARRRELARYREWWVAARQEQRGGAAIETIVTDWARPANLRTPSWLGRYLEATSLPGSSHGSRHQSVR